MLVEEARWLAEKLDGLGCATLSPLLDVGSGTQAFRAETQPWIDAVVFAPLRAAGCEVRHLDVVPGPGIDIVADLTVPAAAAAVAGAGFRAAVCCNLLEHVPDPEELGRAIAGVVAPGGHLLVTCPRRFPYHPDPIDTMLRPTVGELAGLFPGADFVEGEEVPASNLATTYVARALRSPRFLRRAFGHSGAAGVGAAESRPLFDTARWLFRRLSVTCVVLRRPG